MIISYFFILMDKYGWANNFRYKLYFFLNDKFDLCTIVYGMQVTRKVLEVCLTLYIHE